MNSIKQAALKKILFTMHAMDEMNSPDDMISTDEVREALFQGEIIEEYPEDRRGHSYLLFKITKKNRAIHVVCAPKEEYLAIITAYIPSPERWHEDFKTRRVL